MVKGKYLTQTDLIELTFLENFPDNFASDNMGHIKLFFESRKFSELPCSEFEEEIREFLKDCNFVKSHVLKNELGVLTGRGRIATKILRRY